MPYCSRRNCWSEWFTHDCMQALPGPRVDTLTIKNLLKLDAALLPEVLMYKGQAGEASKEYVSEKLMSTSWLHFIVHAGLEAADDWASTDLGVPLNCCLEQQWKPT